MVNHQLEDASNRSYQWTCDGLHGFPSYVTSNKVKAIDLVNDTSISCVNNLLKKYNLESLIRGNQQAVTKDLTSSSKNENKNHMKRSGLRNENSKIRKRKLISTEDKN